MHIDKKRLVLLANDDSEGVSEQARACDAAGLHVVIASVDTSAVELAAAGAPGAMVISLANDAGLHLLQALSRHPRTSHVPAIVVDCASEQVRVRAEQTGSVAIFLDEHAPETMASAVRAVLGLELDHGLHPEFPAWCPKCQGKHGMPRSVSTAALAGTYVGLECGQCGQGWRILRPGALPPIPAS